jgi:hypothetical protein
VAALATTWALNLPRQTLDLSSATVGHDSKKPWRRTATTRAASCETILTSPDAHIQIRDDVAREFAADVLAPGDIYSSAARATGTTEEECEASISP